MVEGGRRQKEDVAAESASDGGPLLVLSPSTRPSPVESKAPYAGSAASYLRSKSHASIGSKTV